MKIAEVFSTRPGPRFKEEGDYSGESFRDDILIPWFNENTKAEKLIVDMTGAKGYPPSFLEESFGGAIRKGRIEDVEKIEFMYPNRQYKIDEIKGYIESAKALL